MITVDKYCADKIAPICKLRHDMHLLTELGVYKLIMRSNKPNADLFQERICELLSRIRLG